MSKLGVVEDTLFVPMLGRIYASEYCPQILYDPKALELKKRLPSGLLEQNGQSQYTLLGFRRSVCQYGLDYPDLSGAQVERRGRSARLRSGDDIFPAATTEGRAGMPWICPMWWSTGGSCCRSRSGRPILPEMPLLRTGSGRSAPMCRMLLFWSLPAGCSIILEESKVVGLLQMLTGFGEIEIVFDAVSKSGMAMMRKKYMKQVGHRDAQMFFYVDSASVLAGKIGSGVRVLAEEPYYRHIPRTGLKLSTKISMAVSDRFGMVKLIRISL